MFRLFILLAFCQFAVASDAKVLGIGAASIDLLIHVDDAFISEHVPAGKGGSQPSSSECIEKVLQLSQQEPKIVPGGSAANAIRALAKLGEHCAFLGSVGTDRFGAHFCENLRDLKIEDKLLKSSQVATSKVLCLVTSDGQRSFLGFDPYVDELQAKTEDFEGMNWVHFEARRLNSGFNVKNAMQLAKESNAKISIDLSSAKVIQANKEILLDLLAHYVDVVFCNEMEIEALTGLPPEEGCLELQKLCPIAVVTIGANGCLVGHKDELIRAPAFSAKIIDSTGAGDYFAAGFLHGFLQGYPLSVCAHIGNRLGASIVEVVGAELQEEKWAEIRNFLSASRLIAGN